MIKYRHGLKLLLPGLLLAVSVQADEGMWPLPLLYQRSAEMQALGLKLQEYDIYHPDSTSLKDAVVLFGGGCTGEVISSEGLVLTNHHCGYSMIQSHSTLERDYLTDGFLAASRREELPCPGLTVTFIEKIEDVTESVKKELEKGTDPQSMNYLSPKYLDSLARLFAGEKILQEHPGMAVEIKAFYGGNQYYLFTKKTYSDIRFVGAPPASIGKFGADTDNWMWPRHTGDFSLFRIYADASGQPAPYAGSNLPLRPKRWFTLSLKGVAEGDFAMIIGFPGRTNQYYTSWEVAERCNIDNTVRIHFRALRQQAMLEEMLKDPSVRLQYTGKYASSTNAYKNAMGSNWAIRRQSFETVTQARQERLYAWAKRYRREEYAQALDSMRQIVAGRADLRRRSWVLDEAIVRGIEFANISSDFRAVIAALQGKDREEQQRQLREVEKAYRRFANRNYAPAVDRKIAKILIAEYLRWIPEDRQPACFTAIRRRYKGDVNRFVEALFEQSIFGSEQHLNRFLAHPAAGKLQRDPLILFAKAVQEEKTYLAEALGTFDAAYAAAHRSYVKGLMEMEQEQVHFPDANLSIRLTYGQVKGYKPRDAVYLTHQTTLDGVMAKEDSTNWEFTVPPRLKALYEVGDFGRYGLPDGRMPVCFTATTHTTGGNSGSPVMNASGELIGINFDRNWEGVGGDIQYIPDYQRSIIVDIRYVLFVIDRYAGGEYLLKEMDIR
ncbi:MAG: S46 family peptidase [Tannerella sp.]|nr:S46 family peptidase [Tannerella sp.]